MPKVLRKNSETGATEVVDRPSDADDTRIASEAAAAETARETELSALAASISVARTTGRTSVAQIRDDLNLALERIARLEGVYDRLS